MRPHWWRNHPLTCTCVDCNDARLRRIAGTRKESVEKNRKKRGRGNSSSGFQPDEILNPKPAELDWDWLSASEETPVQEKTSPDERPAVPSTHPLRTGGKPPPAQRYRSRRGRSRRRRVSPVTVGPSLMAGILFAVFLVVPLLPDAASEVVSDIQRSIGGVFS